MENKQHMELQKKITETQTTVNDTKDALHAINNMLIKLLLTSEEIAKRTLDESAKQFDLHCKVLNNIQATLDKHELKFEEQDKKLEDRNTDCVQLATLHSSSHRTWTMLSGIVGVIALICSWIYITNRAVDSKHFDQLDSNDARHTMYEDQLSDKMSVIYTEVEDLKNKRHY